MQQLKLKSIWKWIGLNPWSLKKRFLSIKFYGFSTKFISFFSLKYKKINETEYNECWKRIKESNGILLPGGFGQRGIMGKMAAAEYARVNKIPFLGVCYGFQLAAINFAREVLKIPDATSEELDENGSELVVVFMPESSLETLGGTLRKGSKTTKIEWVFQFMR